MDVLGALGDEKLGLPRDLEHLARATVDLPGDEEGNELLGHLPEIHVTAHEKVFVTPVGVAQRIGVVCENVDFSRQPLFAQPFFRRRQTGLQQALAGLVMDDEVQNVVALRRRILGMAAGVLIEPRAIDQERIRRPAVGNQSLKDLAKHLFHRQVNPAVRRENETVLILETENTLLHGTG